MRFARAALLPCRGLHAARRNEAGDSLDGRVRPPHSHSIINEPSKLLICNAPEADPQKFTVIFTVKVRSTSIGAGLRAIRPEATFRDLSTSIDSSNHLGHRRRRIGVGQGNDEEGLASNSLSYCPA
jgi:hypothetical protein